jgi:hypothetical protein
MERLMRILALEFRDESPGLERTPWLLSNKQVLRGTMEQSQGRLGWTYLFSRYPNTDPLI